MKKKKVKLILNSILLLSIVTILLKDLNFNKLKEIFFQLDFFFLVPSIILSFIFPIILAIRWQIINERFQIKLSLLSSLKTIIFGQAGSTMAGVSFLNEIIKFFRIDKKTDFVDKLKIIFVDKFISIAAKIFLISPLIFFLFFNHKNYFFFIYIVLLLFTLIIFYYICKKINKLSFFILCSFAHNLFILVSYYFISLSLGVGIEFFYSIIFLIIELVTQIFSFWGTRELTSVYFLNILSISKEKSILVGFLFTLTNLISLIFYIFFLKVKK